MSQSARQTHLEYYREHQITPVRYDLTNLEAHFERRQYLYTKLGLLPLTFKNASILEVAAGTGHNSLYVAQLLPSELTLLEPNEWGLKHLYDSYNSFERPHTKPTVVTCKLEEFSPANKFDIVLCENWLGNSTHELSLLQKLAGMVVKHGILVVTTVSPVGFIPNVLRRLLSSYLAPFSLSFEERSSILVSAFGPHLDTLSAMTRNKLDWVQDNMINPAYFGLCLSISTVIDMIGENYDVISTSPSFAEDWRWFKSQSGVNKDINNHFLREYSAKAHNFLDHRESICISSVESNIELEKIAYQMLRAVEKHEDKMIHQSDTADSLVEIVSLLNDFITYIPAHFSPSIEALNEFKHLIANPKNINLEGVRSLKAFSGLFGRETVYISLIKNK